MEAFKKWSSRWRASAREQELITTEVSTESSSSCRNTRLHVTEGTLSLVIAGMWV